MWSNYDVYCILVFFILASLTWSVIFKFPFRLNYSWHQIDNVRSASDEMSGQIKQHRRLTANLTQLVSCKRECAPLILYICWHILVRPSNWSSYYENRFTKLSVACMIIPLYAANIMTHLSILIQQTRPCECSNSENP